MTTKLDDLEKTLKGARSELALAQKQLKERSEREKQLTEQRAPLLRTAKIGGDKRAQSELDELTRELFSAHQDVADLRRAVADIEGEILALEQRYEQAQHELRVEQLRALMAERNRIGGVVEERLNQFIKEVSKYLRCADEFRALAVELEIPNSTTHNLLGKPLLKDFILNRLKFLFPELGWTDPQQRLPLTQMEQNAKESLELSIRATRKAVA